MELGKLTIIMMILLTIFSVLMIMGMIWYAAHGNTFMLTLFLGLYIVVFTILAVQALTKYP